jgi:hypothetical protein
MNKIELYFSKKNNAYYYIGFATCCVCNKIINHNLIIVRDTKTIERYYCSNCSNKIPKGFGNTLMCLAIISDLLPFDAIPIFNLSVEFGKVSNSSGVVTVWDATTQSKDQELIIDKTIQAHNPRFMIQGDAKDPAFITGVIESEQALLEAKGQFEKVKLASEDELDRLLSSYESAELLEDRFEEKKRLR